jgi:hypothetical protein
MAQFTDNKGTTWILDITIEGIKRVKKALGIDLGNVHEGTPPQAARLDTVVVLLIDVIYVLLRPQAEAKGITDVAFGESLGGDAALAAREAFWRSLVDFFQKFHRPDAVAAIRKQQTLMNQMILLATERINLLDVEETVATILRNSGEPSTAGLESSESIQAR